MTSCRSPLWRRILYKITPFLFKKCPGQNYHWIWDNICHCMWHSYCGEKGGIYDFRRNSWMIDREEYSNILKIKLERGTLLGKIGRELNMSYPLENKEEILKKVKELKNILKEYEKIEGKWVIDQDDKTLDNMSDKNYQSLIQLQIRRNKILKKD